MPEMVNLAKTWKSGYNISEETEEVILSFVNKGGTIQAIREFRFTTNCDLITARNAIYRLEVDMGKRYSMTRRAAPISHETTEIQPFEDRLAGLLQTRTSWSMAQAWAKDIVDMMIRQDMSVMVKNWHGGYAIMPLREEMPDE